MKTFLQNKFDSFSTIYDFCKDESPNISDIKNTTDETDDSGYLKVKVVADPDVMERLKAKSADQNKEGITVDSDSISCGK